MNSSKFNILKYSLNSHNVIYKYTMKSYNAISKIIYSHNKYSTRVVSTFYSSSNNVLNKLYKNWNNIYRYNSNVKYESKITNATKSLKSSFRSRGGISVIDRLSRLIPITTESKEHIYNNISDKHNSNPNEQVQLDKYYNYNEAKSFEEGELIQTTFKYKK